MTAHTLLPLVVLLSLSTPAVAEERRIGLGSFERVRVEGPYRVTIATGASPGATVRGAGGLDGVELRADGGTLVLRRAGGTDWAERRADAGTSSRIPSARSPKCASGTSL